jgi:uncharacterized protein (DUF1697 family)
MADLQAWLSDAGFKEVRTYIQSGNVVFDHLAKIDVVTRVHDAIAENSGFDVPVIVRTAHELSALVASNPYLGVEPTQLHVSFLPSAPDDAALKVAANDDWRPEEFSVVGRDVYLHLPDGMGKSVMAPKLKLIKNATTRNWNTVLALSDLVAH